MFIDVRVILDMQFFIGSSPNLRNCQLESDVYGESDHYVAFWHLYHIGEDSGFSSSEFSLFMALPSEFTLILHEPYKKSDQELLY